MRFVKITLKSNEDVSKNKYKAIVNDKKIIYNDGDTKVTIKLEDKIKMIRENDDYLFDLEFINNKKSKGSCLFKENNMNLELDILTEYIINSDNLLVIKYNVVTTSQNVLYRLEILE